MPQAAKQRPPRRYHDHGDTTGSTGLCQMLGISCPSGYHGLCPAALLETQCVGLQVLMSCQKGHSMIDLKENGNKLLQITLPSTMTMLLVFEAKALCGQRFRLAQYAW